VRRTNALADATVLIVMDSRDDVGEQVAQWKLNVAVDKGVSSLDVAREAASSLASAYIAGGDRVGFQDLSSSRPDDPPRRWRAPPLAAATDDRGDRALPRCPSGTSGPPIVPPGALVYLLSSLLDDQPVSLALTWLGNGHRVIAVDVLPPARFARTTRLRACRPPLGADAARRTAIRVLRDATGSSCCAGPRSLDRCRWRRDCAC